MARTRQQEAREQLAAKRMETARRYIADCIRDALREVDDVDKLLPEARLTDPEGLLDALTAVREKLTECEDLFKEAQL